MAVTLNETPSGNRLHIGIFGKTNSGKSSFINTKLFHISNFFLHIHVIIPIQFRYKNADKRHRVNL